MLIVATLEALAWFLAFDVMNNEGVPYCCPFPPVVVFAMVRGLFICFLYTYTLTIRQTDLAIYHHSPITKNHTQSHIRTTRCASSSRRPSPARSSSSSASATASRGPSTYER